MSQEKFSIGEFDFCPVEVTSAASDLYTEARQENTEALRATGVSPLLDHHIELENAQEGDCKTSLLARKIAGFCLLLDKADKGGVEGKLAKVEHSLARLADRDLEPILKSGGMVSGIRQPFLETEADGMSA